MKSDVVIMLDDFELTKNMDLVESPNFAITKLPDLPLDNEGKQLSLSFLMDDKNLVKARDDLARLVGKDCKLTISIFEGRYWQAKIIEEVTFIRSMASRAEVTVIVPLQLTEINSRSQIIKTAKAYLNQDGAWEFNIDNQGTVAVPISYRIKLKKESGYIGLASERGAAQFGLVEELDGEDYQESDPLINATKTFTEFVPDTGPNATNINFATNGELATMEADGRNVLYLKDAGSGDYWHGGQVTCTLPADSQGGIGADKFYSYFNAVFQTGLISQTGLFTLSFLDEEDKNICSYTVTKHITNANMAQAQFWVGDKCYKTIDFYPTMWNRDNQFAAETGHCSISKNGDNFEFYWRGSGNLNVTVPEMADKKCVKVQIYLAQLRDRTLSEADFLGRLFFRELSFMKLNVDKWRNTPNRFLSTDDIYINGPESRIYVNGLKRDDEIKGTKYVLAEPGENKIQLYLSDFAELESAVAEFEEAYL